MAQIPMTQISLGQSAAKPKPVRLETLRYLLRTLTPADASQRWIDWAADAEVMRPLNVQTRQMTMAELRRYIAGFDQVGNNLIGIFDRATGKHIGFYLIELDFNHRLAVFNVVIGDRDYWGEKVVNETRAKLLDHVFTRTGTEKAVGRPLARNFPAVFNYRAQGWRLEGILKAHRKACDSSARLDQFEFGLTKSEWQKLKEQSREKQSQ